MFRWLRRKPSKTPSEPAVPTDIEEDHIIEVIPEQQHPNRVTSPRLQSVYLSPSERNLYLASLAGLDNPSPLLPLWSEPAPKIPEMDYPTPIPTPMLPSIPSPKPRRRGLSGITPVSFGPRGHAMLTLSGNGELRLVGFNKETILAAEKHLSTWHLGVEGRSRLPEDGGVWRIVLKGRVWRVKGDKERQTIEMLIGLFTVLGQHGWTTVGPMTAGLGKHEFQNIIFSNGSMHAPVYVALSLPLPDRVSIIYPPGGVSGKLVEPIRNAILDASPPAEKGSFTAFKEAAKRSSNSTRRSSASRSSTDTAGTGNSASSGGTARSFRERDPSAIKLEGWVHENVYRFWLAGMSRWSISKSPPLMLEILTALSTEHFTLAASIPLAPRLPGRDLLIFATTASSNISSLDPLLSTPRARPTTIQEDLPDEPRMVYSYDGPSSHPDSDGDMPPPTIMSALQFDPEGPVSRYATPESGVVNGHADARLSPPNTAPQEYPVEAYVASTRPSIDTIKSWASTVNTAQVPGRPGSPGSPNELTPRSSLDPMAWGAQRKKGREGSHSPEPPSSFAVEARRRPMPISPLVYSSVGSTPDLHRVSESDLVRHGSDSSRASRTTIDSVASRVTADSLQGQLGRLPQLRDMARADVAARELPVRTDSKRHSRREPANGHREERDRDRERERSERKGKGKGKEREPNRTPGSRRTRTSIVGDDGQ